MKLFSLVLLLLGVSATSFSQNDVVGQGIIYDFIQKASEITLYSLDPVLPEDAPAPKGKAPEKPAEKFRGYTVFGKIAGQPAELRERLRTILTSAVVSPEDAYMCFSPRIGLSLVYQGRQLDVLLCYQCHQSRYYIGEEWEEGPLGNAGENEFNAILDQRGIKRDIPKPRPTAVPNP